MLIAVKLLTDINPAAKMRLKIMLFLLFNRLLPSILLFKNIFRIYLNLIIFSETRGCGQKAGLQRGSEMSMQNVYRERA